MALLRSCALCLLLFAFPSLQAAYLAPGDPQLRNDIQLLVDHGVINVPVGTWPLPANSLGGLRNASLEQQPGYVRRARTRVLQRLNSWQAEGVRSGIRARLAEQPQQLRSFIDTPRESGELTADVWSQEGWGGYRLAVTGALDPEDDRPLRLDGSFVALRLGNWIVGVGAQERWWGPGWQGSLILGNNHRPVPALSIQRERPLASTLPVLRWLGPWQLTTFLGQLESGRSVSEPFLFGMRFSFKPRPDLEIGLARTAQWGGEGRSESLESFGRMVIGESNFGDTDEDVPGGNANQLAGVDVRWASPLGELPYALYGQLIGEDEAGGLPYRFIGLAGVEFWGRIGGRITQDRVNVYDFRVNLEVADTTAEFHKSTPNYNVAYEHSGYIDGYRYRGRSMGHAMDGDGRMLSLGLQVYTPSGGDWQLLLRHTEQNRDDVQLRPGLSPEPKDITGVDLIYGFEGMGGQVIVSGGGDRVKDRLTDDVDIQGRAWIQFSRGF